MRQRRHVFLVLAFCSTIALTVSCDNQEPTVTAPTSTDEAISEAGKDAFRSRGGRGPAGKISVCHVDGSGNYHLIVINANAWPAHERHGDVQLIDADGDGWFAGSSECAPGGDCNDSNPNIYPGAPDAACDWIDANCDGLVDEAAIVIGSQSTDILRDPVRLSESAMGNLVADAILARYPDADAALTNSGGLRSDLRFAPGALPNDPPGNINCGEIFSVLPFGNTTVLLTLTGAQLMQAIENGVSPACNPTIATGRFPQVSGLKITYSCNGLIPVVTGLWKTPQGIGGPLIPIGPSDTVRLVTNDFLASGGDGYSVLQQGTNVVATGDLMLELLGDYIAAHSPVAPAMGGRIVGP